MNQQQKFLLGFFPSHTDDDMSTPTFPITTTSMHRNHNTAVRSNRNERIEMRRTNVNNSRENQKNREEKFERTEQINRFTHSVTSILAREQYNCPNITSSMANYFPYSHHSRPYEPSYPSITRFRTSFSSSPYRKTHYLDDSDEEILNEEIVETTNLDHYPTLIERWGDDTKIHRRYENDLIIEEFVEFEEIEPTMIEEISYEIDYRNNQIQSSREISRTRSESRNFRRIKKRRTKRKRTHAISPVSHSNDSTNEKFSRPSTTTTHANLSALIDSIPLANIDLIEQDISSENFQSIEQQINQSHISANDVSTRISPISNDKHIQIPEKDVACQSIDSQISAQRIRLENPLATSSTQEKITEAVNQVMDSIEIPFRNDIMEEDEHVELSSDSPVDRFRQIQNTATTVHLPAIEQTEQLKTIENSEHEQSNILEIANETVVPTEQKPLPYPWKTSIETTQISPENVTHSESEFNRFLQDRYFPQIVDEEPLSNHEKDTEADLLKMYYELREQRHHQLVPDRLEIEPEQEISTDHEEHQLFPTNTNLPFTEYRQVFGISDEFMNNDLTSSAQQIIEVTNLDDNTSSIVSSEKENINDEQTTSDAELDFRYSVLLDRMSALLRPLIDLSSTSVITEANLAPSNVATEENLSTSLNDNVEGGESVDQMKLSASTSCEHQQIIDPSNVTNHMKSFVNTVVSSLTGASMKTESTEHANIIIESEIQTPAVTNEQMTMKENQSQQEQVSEPLHQINSTTLQSTSGNETESNTLFNLVGNALSNIKETISQLVTSDDKTSEPTNVSENSDIHPEQSMNTNTTEEEKLSTEIQAVQTPHQLISLNQTDFTDELTMAATPHTQDIEKKPSYEPLQTVIDDYPSHINHYSIANTEATLAQSLQGLNSSHEPTSMTTDMQSGKESSENNGTQNIDPESNQDQDDDGFRLVQRRKRIPSSTIHEKSASSSTTTADSLGPDIDLKPIVLHGNSSAPISSRPVISQTIEAKPKNKRQKSKKNDKKEMILYDAPDLSMNLASSQELKSEPTTPISTLHSREQQTDTSLTQTSPIQTDREDQQELLRQPLQAIHDDYPWYSNHYSIIDAEARLSQLYERLPQFVETTSLPANTQSLDEPSGEVSTENVRLEDNYEHDDTGFQTVQRRKRIPSSTTHEKLAASMNTATTTLSPDIDLKPIVLRGNPTVSMPATSIISETIDTTSKKKRQKSKKNERKQMILYDAPDLPMNLVHSQKSEEDQKVVISTVSSNHETTITTFQQTLSIQTDQSTIEKSQYQPLQVINDDYPWYINHYSIIDAETRFAKIHQQLHASDQVLSSPANDPSLDELVEKTVVESTKVQEEYDQDDTGFQIVQRRKRIPSSTIHDKSLSSVNGTSQVPVSPDIDLKPVILHGNPSASIPSRPVLSQTVDTTSKKKRQKSKKNDKNEMIFYDAPEPLMNFSSPQTTTDEQVQPTSVVRSEHDKTELIPSQSLQVIDDNYPWYTSYYLITDAEARLCQFYEQLHHSDRTVSLPDSTELVEGTISRTTESEGQHDEDDTGFQVVQRRKRIPSSTIHEKLSSSSDAHGVPVSPDIDLKPVILRGNPNAPIASVPLISRTTDGTAKKKRKKSKNKDKDETILYDAPEPTMNIAHLQTPQDEHEEIVSLIDTRDMKMDIVFDEEIDDEHEEEILSQPLQVTNDNHPEVDLHDSIADSELKSARSLDEPLETTVVQTTETNDEDDSGFQIVQRRKRIPSSTIHEKPSASNDIAKIPASPDIDLKPVILHGNPNPLIISTSIVSETTDTTSKKRRKKSNNKDKKEMILYDAPELTHESIVSQTIGDTQTPLIPTINSQDQMANIASVETASISINNENETHLLCQPLQIISDDYPWYSSHYLIIDAETKFAQFYEQFHHSHEAVSQPNNAQTLDESSKDIVVGNAEQENEHAQDDTGFQLVQRRKRIPSSTVHEKTLSTNIDDMKVPVSPDIDLKPVILQGNPNAPIPSMPIISGATDVESKKKRKKSKNKDKNETILYDAPEPTMYKYEQVNLAADTRDLKTDIVFDENEKKPLLQSSQLIDHSEIDTHDSIADSEINGAQSREQLDLSNRTVILPTGAQSLDEPLGKTVAQTTETKDEDDQDNSGFQIVQRRKRIPSSTMHENPSSSNDATKVPASPDIDLKPVILYGNPNVSALSTSIVSETTDTTSKKKRKKSKNKDKKEMILFDAPEPTMNVQAISSTDARDLIMDTVFDEDEKKPLFESSQFIDHSQLDRHSPIVDSEVKSARSFDEPAEKTAVQTPETKDEDDSGFQIVQRRKRIPSSTMHEKPSSSNDVTKVPVSPDIDLKPVILHGNPNPLIHSTPIASEMADVSPKKRHKKSKKNDKKETVLYDAPEPTVNTAHFEQITDQTMHLVSTGNSEDQKVENSSDETSSMQINDQQNAVDSSVSSTIESKAVKEELIVQSALPATSNITKTKIASSSKAQEEEEDNEGFQVVRYRGRILSAPKPEPSAVTTIDRDVATIASEESSSSSPKQKGNKHKKQKKEVQPPINIETELNTPPDVPSSSSIVEDSSIPSQSISSTTITTKVILSKPPVCQDDDEEEEDNEGFQLVTHRKRMTSAPRSANIPSSTSTKTRYERPVNRNVDQNRFAFHGRHGSASPSVPHTSTNSKSTSNQNFPSKTRQDKRQISSFSTPPRSVSVETSPITSTSASNTPQLSKNLKQKVVHEQQPKETKSEPPVSKDEPIKQITEAIPIPEQLSSILSSVIDTDVEESAEQNDNLLRIPVPQTLALPDTVETKTSTTNENSAGSLSITNIDSTPLSVEEMVDQNTSTNFVSTSSMSPNTSSTTATSTEEPVGSLNESQHQQDSIHTIEETAKPSDESTNKIDDPVVTKQPKSEESIPPTVPVVVLDSTITAEDEQQTADKPMKRRKKKSHRKDKANDEPVFTPSTATPISNDIPTESKVKETPIISSHTSTTFSEEVSSKLDLFLPEYMRQQINTPQPSSSLPTWSKTTSSEVISKKTRSKLLTKDHDAQSLLTNEFEHQNVSTNTSDIQQTSSSFDAESSLHSISSIGSNQFDHSSSVDNILSRGFYLWLQESQALSEQKPQPGNIMQNIVIQSSEIPEDDEDDCGHASKVHRSTYMTGIQANKRIHLMNAYAINHPQSISTPSWLIRQSHEKTFADKLDTFDSGHEDESFTDESKKSTDTQSNSSHRSHPSVKSSKQNLVKNNFDDWAHFYPSRTTHSLTGNLSRPLEYFYTQTFDDDTLLSTAIPNQHSMKSKQQRYGDFHPSNLDDSTLKCPSSKFKPSNYFQKSISNFSESNDDEIIITHSSTGLSRHVRP